MPVAFWSAEIRSFLKGKRLFRWLTWGWWSAFVGMFSSENRSPLRTMKKCPTPRTECARSLSSHRFALLALGLASCLTWNSFAAEPAAKSGWPLTPAEEAYVLTPEHQRRPGAEINQHLPELWPVTPSAGYWANNNRAWLDVHARRVEAVQAARGPIDILLVGDSITAQWGGTDGKPFGTAWTKAFGAFKTVNLGIGGDKTQNVLWRLDHGSMDGIEPRLIVLMIGNNNMFFTRETGIEAAARGVKACVDKLRGRFPKADLIVFKIFPAHAPGNTFYEDIRKANAAIDTLGLTADPKVQLIDLTSELLKPDGSLRTEYYQPDNIHLNQDVGYGMWATKLQPLVKRSLGGK
jgi:lysophospholipase L1-like esterase